MDQQEESSTGSFLNLPLDILVTIFPYLEAKDFLALCGTCRALNDDALRFDNAYWSQAAQKTFRVRNRPKIPNWYRLYYRLRTQSKVYTWGQNSRGCLGHKKMQPDLASEPQRRLTFSEGLTAPGIPEQMAKHSEIGVIADLQCGGWSTSLLNSKGIIYTVGDINGGSRFAFRSRTHKLRKMGDVLPLAFPPGYPKPGETYDPRTAIRSFSSGRAHILGLSDSGRIWQWVDAEEDPLYITFNALEYSDGKSKEKKESHEVRDVVAGWSRSTAYITGIGIIMWEVPQTQDRRSDTDRHLPQGFITTINEWVNIPRSDYSRPSVKRRGFVDETDMRGEEVGQVKNWVVLEDFVVFVTDVGKVFATKILDPHNSVELGELQSASHEDTAPIAADVQGSFRSFAVLKNNDEVVIANQDYLRMKWNESLAAPIDSVPVSEPSTTTGLMIVPALQKSGVIQIAFGDYHYHALHSNGTISSYGKEPGGCGALGLGTLGPVNTVNGAMSTPISWYRGVVSESGPGTDSRLLPHGYISSRKMWFQPELYDWLTHVATGGADFKESSERFRDILDTDERLLGELAELIEQYSTEARTATAPKTEGTVGSSFEAFQPPMPSLAADPTDDDLGTHFALAVTAAGWHSGALVLVNESREKAVGKSCQVAAASPELEPAFAWSKDLFPRFQPTSGIELPGTAPLSPWKKPPAQRIHEA